jgi:hypothetical protein
METIEKKREYEPPQHRALLVVLAVLRRTGMHPAGEHSGLLHEDVFSASSGSGGTRTHSIPGSKPRWSADCLPSQLFHQCPEQESNLQTSGFKPDRSAGWRIRAE